MVTFKTVSTGILLTFIMLASPVLAGEIKDYFGHKVEIREGSEQNELYVDGNKVHENQILFIDQVNLVNKVPAIVGTSSAGGNACDGTPFVLSFPEGAAPRFDGPIDACASIEYEFAGDKITFHTADIPGQGMQRWAWTLEQGLQELEKVAFKPDASQTWNSLREHTIDHPSDLLKNADVSKALQDLLGPDFSAFQSIITGTGSGEFKDDSYVGSVCQSHMCGSVEVFVFVSVRDHKIFAGMKPDNEKIRVYPDLKSWPKKARSEMKAWASTWK